MRDLRYFLYHKPIGVVCSRVDSCPTRDRPRPTAYGECAAKGFPIDVGMVGRLDTDTSGVLLFTDDTELNQAITSPNFSGNMHHHKTYVVSVTASRPDLVPNKCEDPSASILTHRLENELSKPLEFKLKGRDFVTHPPRSVRITRIWREPRQEYDKSGAHFMAEIAIVLTEGKNRQIRRLCQRSNLKVKGLHRTSIAGLLRVESVPNPGDVRWLQGTEVSELCDAFGVPPKRRKSSSHISVNLFRLSPFFLKGDVTVLVILVLFLTLKSSLGLERSENGLEIEDCSDYTPPSLLDTHLNLFPDQGTLGCTPGVRLKTECPIVCVDLLRSSIPSGKKMIETKYVHPYVTHNQSLIRLYESCNAMRCFDGLPGREAGRPIQYIHIPKTGGSSVQRMLGAAAHSSPELHLPQISTQEYFDSTGRSMYKNSTCIAFGHRTIAWDMNLASRLPIYVVTVREPVSFAVSLFDFITQGKVHTDVRKLIGDRNMSTCVESGDPLIMSFVRDKQTSFLTLSPVVYEFCSTCGFVQGPQGEKFKDQVERSQSAFVTPWLLDEVIQSSVECVLKVIEGVHVIATSDNLDSLLVQLRWRTGWLGFSTESFSHVNHIKESSKSQLSTRALKFLNSAAARFNMDKALYEKAAVLSNARSKQAEGCLFKKTGRSVRVK